MKKILVAFEGSSFAQGALDYAIQLSAADDSLIVGVFIEDLSYLGYATLFGEDYFSFNPTVLNQMEKEAEGNIEENIKIFEQCCRTAGRKCKVHLDKGVPAAELIRESLFADLILLGYQAFFSGVTGDTSFLKDVLIDSECPVLVVPSNCRPVSNLIFTFEGKNGSVYAIKQFTATFPEFRHLPVTLLHVAKSKEESAIYVNLIREYLAVHYSSVQYEVISGHAEESILGFAEMQHQPLVVMGAFGRSGVSRFFSRSTAGRLLKEKSVPIFIAHK